MQPGNSAVRRLIEERLGLSFSYICQLENNQRPVTASVLLKLTQVFQVDLSDFSEDLFCSASQCNNGWILLTLHVKAKRNFKLSLKTN